MLHDDKIQRISLAKANHCQVHEVLRTFDFDANKPDNFPFEELVSTISRKS